MRITAYDESQWRVERLQKMLKLAVTTTGLSMVQIYAIIEEVHDHKGELVVTWKHGDCTERMKLAFKDAWQMCGEHNVHHNGSGVF
jgi:hypothetical protein